MTKPTPSAHRAMSGAVMAMALVIAVIGCTSSAGQSAGPTTSAAAPAVASTSVVPLSITTSPESPMPKHPDGLWPMVAAISAAVPLTPAAFGTLLQTPMAGTGHDQYSSRWAGGPISLADGVEITSSELRVDPDGQWRPFALAAVTVGGRCVTVDEIKKNYPDVQFTGGPEDLGGGPPPSWSSPQPWGTLIFDLNRAPTACLTNISFTSDQS
jgi:hypothetical protein